MEKVGLEDGMSRRASDELRQYENRYDSDNETTFDGDNDSNVGGCDSDGQKQHLLYTSGDNILRYTRIPYQAWYNIRSISQIWYEKGHFYSRASNRLILAANGSSILCTVGCKAGRDEISDKSHLFLRSQRIFRIPLVASQLPQTMAEIAVLPSLESAKGKLEQNGFPFAGLPNDRNSLLWGDIRRECGLSLAEVSFLQNASAGTTSKSVMFHYLLISMPSDDFYAYLFDVRRLQPISQLNL